MKASRNILTAVLLSFLAVSGPAFANDQPANIPEQPALRTTLTRELVSLKQEYRLRTRASALLTEISLFDEYAMRGREVLAAEGNFQSLTGGPTVGSRGNAGFETTGIGDRAPGEDFAVSDLEALKEEILILRRKLEEK